MEKDNRFSRRNFLRTASVGAASFGIVKSLGSPEKAEAAMDYGVPLKIGHRASSMRKVGDYDVIKFASRIPGLMGVELQVTAGAPVNLRDWDVVRHYKKEAHRWGMQIQSLAGVWDPWNSPYERPNRFQLPTVAQNLIESIRAAEILGSSVILAAFFSRPNRQDCPDMNDESQYGPVVQVFQDTAKYAADAGVVLGLENSLSPADNKKLVDLIDRPSVKVYLDVHNGYHYGHPDKMMDGFKLLGAERIAMIHVKNGNLAIDDPGGAMNWKETFSRLNEIGYGGWYVFETSHSRREGGKVITQSEEEIIEQTAHNIEFMKQVCKMPKS